MTAITVATCQFPVSADVDDNLEFIERQLRLAADRGADVAHFPEGALSGYAGALFDSFDGFDWTRLESATHRDGFSRCVVVVDPNRVRVRRPQDPERQ